MFWVYRRGFRALCRLLGTSGSRVRAEGGTRVNWGNKGQSEEQEEREGRGKGRGGGTLLNSRLDFEPCLCLRSGLLWGSRSSQPHSEVISPRLVTPSIRG